MLRSITRLLLGAAQIGLENISALIKEIENEEDRPFQISSDKYEKDIQEEYPKGPVPMQPENNLKLRYAMLGLLFESQERIEKSLNITNRLMHSSSEKVSRLLSPLSQTRLLKPLRNRYNHLVSVGEDKLDKWVELGKVEETKSRAYIREFIDYTTDRGIVAITTNPDVVELVEAQSVTLAGEVVEEIRERTVSGDNYLESILRKFLRLAPRSQLPPPPQQVRDRAIPPYSRKRKSI